jgi:hypothetical protein
MQYSQVRESIRDGDLILVRGRSVRAWLIRAWTQSRFSHCGIAVWVVIRGVGRLCVLEAVEGRGVHLQPLSTVLRRDGEFDWFPLWDESERVTHAATALSRIDRANVTAFGLAQWGKRYASCWQFVRSFSIASRWLFDWLGLEVDTDRERFFCSEFVMGAVEAGGYRPSRDCDPAEMSPGDIAELGCFYRKGRVTE